MKVKANLIIAYVALIVVVIGLLGFMAISKSQEALIQEEMKKVDFIVDSMYTLVEMRQSLLQKQIQNDLYTTSKMLSKHGPLRIDHEKLIRVGDFELPAMYAGTHLLTGDTSFVDEQLAYLGSDCTVFYLHEDRFVRISTTIRLESGERALGTVIDSSSPVYQSVIQKRPYYARAWVVNDWYITAYEPLFDAERRIIGMLYNGVPELDGRLREIFDNLRIGKAGYLYVMNSDAEVVFHPTGRDDLRVDPRHASRIIEMKSGNIEFVQQGSKKLATFKYFEPWDWYIIATMRLDEMRSSIQGIVNAVITIVIISIVIVMALIVNQKVDFLGRKNRS